MDEVARYKDRLHDKSSNADVNKKFPCKTEKCQSATATIENHSISSNFWRFYKKHYRRFFRGYLNIIWKTLWIMLWTLLFLENSLFTPQDKEGSWLSQLFTIKYSIANNSAEGILQYALLLLHISIFYSQNWPLIVLFSKIDKFENLHLNDW